MKRIYTTTLRLNLDDEDDRRAYEYLQGMDRKQYRSYSRAVVAAVNDHFERQAQLASDPYLETREKEDAFLRKVTEAIGQGLRLAPAGMLPYMPPAAFRLPMMTRIFRRLWTLLTASDAAFAPVWYCCDTKRGHFCCNSDFKQRSDINRKDIRYHAPINEPYFYCQKTEATIRRLS